MRLNKILGFLVTPLLVGAILTACGAQPPTSEAPAEEGVAVSTDDLTPVTVQLKWVAQAQFAGYYAAEEQGFFAEEGLDVTIRPGGPDIVPEQVVASGQAEFGLGWLAALLAVRDQGTPLVNIAQVYTRGGMRQLTWADSGIESPADFAGKRVAIWFGGNEFNLLATLNKYNLDPDADLELVQQPFDMNLFLAREVDSAAAMTYNELYQVLSAGHTIDELNIIDYNAEGTAMLEDGIFVHEDWLAEEGNDEIAARFLRGAFKGWEFCRDNPGACVDSVLQNDESGVMTREAQEWQMDEVNKLIWGDPLDPATPIGYMEPELFQRTAEIALEFGVIENPATKDAYTHMIWEMATSAR
ncbi:MAG: ABC transporter substrate-binding protein [Chloroflexales bacterium]|nr:ABC transporter substrate-binding protein [Chloroflexales bacterium]